MGRKTLGLTKEEMKVRRELQRIARLTAKRDAERREIIKSIVDKVLMLEKDYTAEEIVRTLMDDRSIFYRRDTRVDTSKTIKGYNGARLSRRR